MSEEILSDWPGVTGAAEKRIDMNIFYDNAQLLKLISNMHELTGIWLNIHEPSGRDIRIRSAHTEFCRAINDIPEGHARCTACDADAARLCRQRLEPWHYRCHAGICETLVPIVKAGEVISYLGFGQLLDESPIEEQWKCTRETLGWYPGDLEELHGKFLKIRQYPSGKTAAMTEILKILASHPEFHDAVVPAGHTDLQRLEQYLSRHYAEKLSIKKIASDLHFGDTKLCKLAKTLSNGRSLTWLIAYRRVLAAQKLLAATDLAVSEIALTVGYEDYNYFTKVFKKITGITPSRYRRIQRR